MNIEQNNKLITEFMGYTYNPETTTNYGMYIINNGAYTVGSLKFHNSWDWLMPVIEKIESLVTPKDIFYNFIISGGCQVYIFSSSGDEIVDSDKGQSKIECAYKAVVEFIEWYNKSEICG